MKLKQLTEMPAYKGNIISEQHHDEMYGLQDFLDSYKETALWSSTDNDSGEPLDRESSVEDFSPETEKEMREDAISFIKQTDGLIDYDDQEQVIRAGHDFWLTRNHHGAGFWDGDWGDELGEKLTKISHHFPEVNLHPYGGQIVQEAKNNSNKKPLKEGFESDGAMAKELHLYIDNTSKLHPKKTQIMKNLARKMKRGDYDHDLAVVLWMYLVDDGARLYAKEMGVEGERWFETWPKHIRKIVAEKEAEQFEEEAKVNQHAVSDLSEKMSEHHVVEVNKDHLKEVIKKSVRRHLHEGLKTQKRKKTMKVTKKQFVKMIREAVREQLALSEAGSGVEVKDVMIDVLRDSGMTDTDILTQLVAALDDQAVRTALGALVSQAQGK